MKKGKKSAKKVVKQVKMNHAVLVLGFALLGIMALYAIGPWSMNGDETPSGRTIEVTSIKETSFSNIGLSTNTAISSIPLTNILGGGPPKDGIPAIFEPKFTTIENADEWLDDEGLGIIFENSGVTRFYPYAILYWHEIVDDTVGDKNVAVTFCPLCGSAIIFDRGEDVFGVSGKLWESNLLMYDKKTESLWSQIIGEAVVGDRTGEVLKILDANVISFAEVKERFATAEILSKDTGHYRSYGKSPYGNYEENNSLFFPVSNSDEAFHKKELFYIVNMGDKTVGFMRKDLLKEKKAELEVDGQIIKAEVQGDSEITVSNLETGEELPGYIAMWFSWVTHQGKERVVWTK